MAKVVSQNIVITISKLSKDSSADTAKFIDDDTIKQLEEVVQQLVGDESLVVEAADAE